MQGVLASLVFEGVFEQFPQLRVCLIVCGFTWVPALCWSMDKQWQRYRAEVPHLRRPPSEYVRELRRGYEEIGALSGRAASAEEQRWSREWMAERFDQSRLSTEREKIVARGRTQNTSDPSS